MVNMISTCSFLNRFRSFEWWSTLTHTWKCSSKWNFITIYISCIMYHIYRIIEREHSIIYIYIIIYIVIGVHIPSSGDYWKTSPFSHHFRRLGGRISCGSRWGNVTCREL
jgi:hypothetical protein